MFNEATGVLKIALSILFFPLFFQDAFLYFAWGGNDPAWLMIGKRLFILLPTLAIIGGCWLTIASFLTVIVRQNRREFVTTLVITWWDLGKSIMAFWGGIFSFIYTLSSASVALLKIVVLGIWSLIQDIILTPFRLIRNLVHNVVNADVPWIAVWLTLFWTLIEATIFTYVMTTLVIDTFSNITGEQLSENFIRIPLFFFLLIVVLGSYAVLSTFLDSVKSKNIGSIIGIGVLEIIVLFVEVIFLYREFVDSLVPWLAQYSENFELGIFWTLAISTFVWFGIRSLSWVLFAAHGTPTILAVIQGKGIKIGKQDKPVPSNRLLGVSIDFMGKIKEDSDWVKKKSEEVVASFMLPPLQVIAASINFCMLLIRGGHLFETPFKNMDAIRESKDLTKNIIRLERTLS